jgi:hypothetical protein
MRLLNRGVLLGLSSLLSISLYAQDDIDQLLTENLTDAKKLIGAYVSPAMKSISLGLNQGWYNTAKPHKIAGVDITFTANAMTIPKDEFFYEPAKLGLTQVSLDNSSEDFPKAPTIFGVDNAPTFRSNSTGTTFDGPPGIDLEGSLKVNWIPVPIAHFGFGLPKNTDVKIRFTPDINIGDDSQVKIFGIGILHDVKQWIPGIKLLPFDLAGFVGFTKFTFQSDFNGQSVSGQNQQAVFEMNTTTIQGVISKKFSVVTFYGGVGYNVANSNLAMKGTYDLNGDGDTNDTSEKDPLDLKFGASGPRVTVGTRLKLAIFTIHADYTVQKYKCLTVGFGLSVR